MGTVFYYLLKQPNIMQQLQAEIRTAFQSYDEIGAMSTNNLSFLIAVIREAMRIYPPVPLALPRTVPEGGDTIDGRFVPAGVRCARSAPKQDANIHRPRFQHILSQRAWTRRTSKIRGCFVPRGGLEKASKTCVKHLSPSR